tara:strand:+ start:1676 stop:2068 length:393 start_codon:yes stop_codon:yes gene_type:complete
MATALTPELPLTRDTQNNYVLIKSYKNLARQNFKNLLLTIPGERVMDINFGVGLKRFLFEMDNPALYANISERINSQIKQYLPYIEIVETTIDTFATNANISPHALSIVIQYQILPLNEIDTLVLTLPDD